VEADGGFLNEVEVALAEGGLGATPCNFQY
jgi:hypothetical protein